MQGLPSKAVVSVVAERDRYCAVREALEALGPALPARLAAAKKILIKPNFVSCRHPLAATHVDASRAVLEYIMPHVGGDVVIGEGPALGEAAEGFDAYGYRALAEEYGVPLLDLNRAPTTSFQVFNENLAPLTVRLAQPALESDFRVAVGPPKAHDAVIVTLSVKNMVMGAVVRTAAAMGPGDDKWAMHQGYPAMNINLYLVAREVWPHLGVVDGHVGMEGDGPIYGSAVPWGFAAASLDPLALDYVVCKMMGVEPSDVGYLYYCGRAGLGAFVEDDIEIAGSGNPAALTRKVKLHATAPAQYDWRLGEAQLAKLALF
ncbi:MAG: DUF362 domain-containing protein [candidate division Zixibacteria bacterium]|nr:DUF362 domain-containing protein [candidate division Zixibacteria bacterium]